MTLNKAWNIIRYSNYVDRTGQTWTVDTILNHDNQILVVCSAYGLKEIRTFPIEDFFTDVCTSFGTSPKMAGVGPQLEKFPF